MKSVLFIAVDDLRPELETYGSNVIRSPNIDKLACKRPDSNHVWRISNDEYWRDYTNATTIPQYFKENGYISVGMGKIFHPGPPSGNDDRAYSWSLPYYHTPIVAGNHKVWESFEGYADDQLQDGQLADNAVEVLRDLKQNRNQGDNRPFFVAVGFHKLHFPWYAPSKYYDLYPPAENVELPKNPDVPKDFPPVARALTEPFIDFIDLKSFFPNMTKCFTDVQASFYGKECRIPDDYTRVLRRAYYACVSYSDSLVGKVVSELKAQGFADDTIIVLWADHGYQLGEHNHWEKQTNFETATHVPFMIRVPGVTDHGMRTKAFVELIDIFPSITELAGLDVPPMCPEQDHKLLACIEGTSVTPLLKNPNQQWKKTAFTQYPRPQRGLIQISNEPPYILDEHQ